MKETDSNPNNKMDDNVDDFNVKIAQIDTAAASGTGHDQANINKYTPHANEGALNQFKVGEYLDGVKMDRTRSFGSCDSNSVRDSIVSQDSIDSVNLEEDPFSDETGDLSAGYSR